MTGKERIRAMFGRKRVDRPGFWLGNPADETKKTYAEYMNLGNSKKNEIPVNAASPLKATEIADLDIALHVAFQSDLFWACPQLDPGLYKHPEGKPLFDIFGGKPRESLTQPGVFAEVDDAAQIEAFNWPDPAYLDFSRTLQWIDRAQMHDMAVFSGMWMPFFHDLCDFFGMENYFMKMYTHPDVVEAATEKILGFYLEANRRLLDQAGHTVDALFFGNDLGSQFNPLIGPDPFKKFLLPGIKRIIQQAKQYDLSVVLHSCGAVSDFIPAFIDAGIDGLHPLQAKAAGMDAETLSRQFKNDIVFIGGVDTQELLPFGTTGQIYEEVNRLTDLFGERFVVSPSHEALLPNVSFENATAMKDAVVSGEDANI